MKGFVCIVFLRCGIAEHFIRISRMNLSELLLRKKTQLLFTYLFFPLCRGRKTDTDNSEHLILCEKDKGGAFRASEPVSQDSFRATLCVLRVSEELLNIKLQRVSFQQTSIV